MNCYKLSPGFFVFYMFLDSCLVIPLFFFFFFYSNLQIWFTMFIPKKMFCLSCRTSCYKVSLYNFLLCIVCKHSDNCVCQHNFTWNRLKFVAYLTVLRTVQRYYLKYKCVLSHVQLSFSYFLSWKWILIDKNHCSLDYLWLKARSMLKLQFLFQVWPQVSLCRVSSIFYIMLPSYASSALVVPFILGVLLHLPPFPS